jgi:hypothetical protein
VQYGLLTRGCTALFCWAISYYAEVADYQSKNIAMQILKRFLTTISIGLAGIALIALALIVLGPVSAPAQPVISWERGAVCFEVVVILRSQRVSGSEAQLA